MSANNSLKKSEQSSRKLGEVVAEQIEDEIVAAGWPIGEVIGSETELQERYGVSRAVFREAIRIVGHHGVAEMRRGPGGGLVVVEPSIDAAVRAVSLNLEYLDMSPRQINEGRLAIEQACVRMAIRDLNKAGEAKIREYLDGEVDRIVDAHDPDHTSDNYAANDFHVLLAELSGNPAMVLFVQILSRITSRHSDRSTSIEDTAAAVHQVHARIAEAILERDVEKAKRRMKRHLDSIVDHMHP